MTSQEALQSAIELSIASVTGNGTTKVSLNCQYPIFDIALDVNLKFDILIYPTVEFPINKIIAVKIGSNPQAFFTVSSNSKALWLSELMGITRELFNIKVTETIEFEFQNPELVQFKLITALDGNFGNAIDIVNNGLTSEQFLIKATSINPSDESSVSAIRNAIDNTTSVVTNNGTNVITVNNIYPIFGSQLPMTYIVDSLITFEKILPMGSEIFIKHNGVFYKKVITTKNFKNIWFSDLVEDTRGALFSKVTEEYEFTFVYDQSINIKLITGELTNFTNCNVVVNQLTYGLFEVANSNSLISNPIILNDCNFVITYEDYERIIKSARLELGNDQYINIDYVMDNSTTPPKKYMRISHLDENYNVEINLLMDMKGIVNYLELLKDMARGLYVK